MIGSLGESLIDFTPVEAAGVLTGFELHPGGSPFNVALAIGRLGYPAAFVGKISTDLFGERLVGALESAGVDTSFVVRAAEPTTLAFVVYDGVDATYSFRGDGTADALLTISDVDAAALSSLEALHLGSIGLVRRPVGSTALELARLLRGQVVLCLDPNVRPALVDDWDDYRARLGELGRLADVVKASEADLEAWEADPASLAESAAAVVVTRGALGCTVHAAGEVFDVDAWPCSVADTIGAGDAFTAGLLVALGNANALTPERLGRLGVDEWRGAVEYAAAVSALTCEQRGALGPTAAAVEALLSRSRC